MTYSIDNTNLVTADTCTPAIGTKRIPISRPLVFGLAGLAFTLLTVLPNPAFAIQHGCTTGGDPWDLTIDIDLGGKKSQVSGGFCEAIGRAEAAIAKSRLTKEKSPNQGGETGSISAT